ncbi:MAG: NADH-quinone oxidoreductase subunit J [Gammaproteobacteria bacterium]|jgi:NADH-quinone oxidoreductase subunit J|nr:NADH-quinone oxidoreductase subunit J [Gammaproteobacteria bacterium]MDH3750405.1 NADH-quinone oxidoreductase subunit J [Gammaproteobacteria bacterium]
MLFHAILFYFFSVILIGAACGVIFSKNPVHAIMFLVLAFFQSAMLWLLVEAEFLAIVLVLVYVGAVMVLFLFVVMMLDINVEAIQRSLTRFAPFAIAVALLMAIELVQLIWLRSRTDAGPGVFESYPEGYSNTKALGSVLYTEHVYAFEIAAVVLLLAIVAAISLTMRKRPGLKVQNIGQQVAVRAKDRLRVVKMESEKKQ